MTQRTFIIFGICLAAVLTLLRLSGPPLSDPEGQPAAPEAQTKPHEIVSAANNPAPSTKETLAVPTVSSATANHSTALTKPVNPALQALLIDEPSPQQISIQLPTGDWEVLDLNRHRSMGGEGLDAQWTGAIKGQPGSLVVVTRWKGAVYGSVTSKQGVFEIRADEKGQLTVLPTVDLGCEVDADGLMEHDDQDYLESDQDDALTDGDSLITVVIAYNQQAADSVGGVATLEAKILTAVQEANESYAYCSVNLRLGLAWLGQIDYPYSASQSFTEALNEAINPTDGQADLLAAKRAEYGADFASLWLASDVTGGLAKVLTSPLSSDNAYNVIRAKNPTNTFIHELGHNMGCRHLRNSYSGTVSSWHPYSYANVFYGNDGEKYITVMGSTGNASDEDAMRIPYFSGPFVTFQGVSTGWPEDTDCARTLLTNRMDYADFRERTPVQNQMDVGSSQHVLTLRNVMVGENYTLSQSSNLTFWSPLPAVSADNDGEVSSIRPATTDPVFFRWESTP